MCRGLLELLTRVKNFFQAGGAGGGARGMSDAKANTGGGGWNGGGYAGGSDIVIIRAIHDFSAINQ